MAKGQKRSSRELKKPKKAKPKVVATAGLASKAQGKAEPSARDKKKW